MERGKYKIIKNNMELEFKTIPITAGVTTLRNNLEQNVFFNKNSSNTTLKKQVYSDYSPNYFLDSLPTQLNRVQDKNMNNDEDFNKVSSPESECTYLKMRTHSYPLCKIKTSKYWTKLRNVFNACVKFKIFDVQVISLVKIKQDKINSEIRDYVGRTSPKEKAQSNKTFNEKIIFNIAIDEIEFFELISRGASSDISKIKKIIDKSPDLLDKIDFYMIFLQNPA